MTGNRPTVLGIDLGGPNSRLAASIGIETLGGVFTRLIKRDTALPTKMNQVFSTAEDNQNGVTIRVFQGEREVAVHNLLLGQFDLVGIPPAPRGVPQIEVTFDVDVNGIFTVSAKDKGTGKEQQIRIEASGGLSQAEIDNMVKEAEQHAEEDRKRKDQIEARNQADSMIYSTEKSLKEHGDKIGAHDRAAVERAIANLRGVLDSADADNLRSKTENLAQLSMKLGEAMYAAPAEAASLDQQNTLATGYDVFISYDREDTSFVENLVGCLEKEGLSVWSDSRIEIGGDFALAIEQALSSAKCVLVVWSQRSVWSTWVRNEATEGASRKVLIPLQIDDARPPLQFRHIQAADFRSWSGDMRSERFRKLIRSINSIIQS